MDIFCANTCEHHRATHVNYYDFMLIPINSLTPSWQVERSVLRLCWNFQVEVEIGKCT